MRYSFSHFQKDVVAGTIVGVVAIPLGMAFAIASGVKPEFGIYTTIVAGLLLAIFGGSRFQISGPTGAFIPVLLGIVLTYGYQNLLIAGFMAGVLLLLMGVFRLGSLIRYIPRPVITGFTAGIAVIIFTGQISNFFGLTGIKSHEDFISNMRELILHFYTINFYSVGTALISLIVILFFMKVLPRIPGSLMGLVVSSLIANAFFADKVATIGSTFGAIPVGLPRFEVPSVSWQTMFGLIQPAFIIAMLGSIESLLSAVVADAMSNTKHNSNKELIGQGITNMVVPFFGGIPATGAIARTATNIKNGAVSPLSGVIHSLVVMLVLLLFAPYASAIPLASMAPVLMIVAWNMSERKEFSDIIHTKTNDSLVLIVTFLLTVFVSLTTAVEVGLFLAMLFYIKNSSELLQVVKVLPDLSDKHQKLQSHVVSGTHDCPQLGIFTVEGALFFGSATSFEESVTAAVKNPNILILRMSKVSYVDLTGEAKLAKIIESFQRRGIRVMVSGLQKQPKSILKKTHVYDKIGTNNFFKNTGDAVDFAISIMNKQICLGCCQLAFQECIKLSRPLTPEEVVYNEIGTTTVQS